MNWGLWIKDYELRIMARGLLRKDEAWPPPRFYWSWRGRMTWGARRYICGRGWKTVKTPFPVMFFTWEYPRHCSPPPASPAPPRTYSSGGPADIWQGACVQVLRFLGSGRFLCGCWYQYLRPSLQNEINNFKISGKKSHICFLVCQTPVKKS